MHCSRIHIRKEAGSRSFISSPSSLTMILICMLSSIRLIQSSTISIEFSLLEGGITLCSDKLMVIKNVVLLLCKTTCKMLIPNLTIQWMILIVLLINLKDNIKKFMSFVSLMSKTILKLSLRSIQSRKSLTAMKLLNISILTRSVPSTPTATSCSTTNPHQK